MATASQSAFETPRMLSARLAVVRPEPGDLTRDSSTFISESACAHLRTSAIRNSQKFRVSSARKSLPDFEEKFEDIAESISKACRYLNKRISAGVRLEGDSHWLCDNEKIYQECLQETKSSLREVSKLPQIQLAGNFRQSRAYIAACSYLDLTDLYFDEHSFSVFLAAYQEDSPFEIEELWAFKAFVQFALLERIATVAERLVPEARFTKRLLLQSSDSNTVSVQAAVVGLRWIADLDWTKTFEQACIPEQILKTDPSGTYQCMTPETRGAYRRAIVELARRSNCDESAVALRAVKLASLPHPDMDRRAQERRSHVGYFLVDKGREALEGQIAYRPLFSERFLRVVKRWPEF